MEQSGEKEEISKREWDVINTLGRVNIVHCSDGGPLHWVVWDQNLDTNESLGHVYVGREVRRVDDKYEPLDNPPGDVHWAWEQARARAILRLAA